MGDDYYNVDHRASNSSDQTAAQQQSLEQNSIFKQLREDRFRSGTGERTRCFGSDANARIETSTVELIDIKQRENTHKSDKGLVIDAYESSSTDSRLRRESLYLPSTRNAVINAPKDSDMLRVNTRFRQRTRDGSYLRETAISAIPTDYGVEVKQLIYVNGFLAEWSSWSLDRRS